MKEGNPASAETKKRLFTGLQSSGTLHLGNYFGALKPFVEMYEGNESFLMVADYHALTSVKDGAKVREDILNVVRDYVGAGVDSGKVIIFKQSDVPQHTELAWVLECQVTVPFLMQAHAYKDKVAKGLEANAGLFNYPMLMAADILLYDTDLVPVGKDQQQHVEYAREAANKFNNAYGETFKEPQEMILKGVGTVPGIDGEKMSKSYKNTIPLFGTKDEIAKAVMSIVTDSGAKEHRTDGKIEILPVALATNVFKIHRLFKNESELVPFYNKNENNYKTLKEALIEDIEATVKPMRERRDAVSDEGVKEILAAGAEKAREIAEVKMQEVREKVGVTI